MARKSAEQRKGLSRLHNVASAVKRLFGRTRDRAEEVTEDISQSATPRAAATPTAPQARAPRIDADIPLDVLARIYTPHHTSSKTSFRSDGRDHERDQELAFGVADERWNDEDRFTNKSGDPRIGTHRRTYEPGEELAESRD